MFDWDQLAPILKTPGLRLSTLESMASLARRMTSKILSPLHKSILGVEKSPRQWFFFFLSLLAKVLTSSLYNPQIKLIGLKSLYPIPPFFKMRARKVVFKHLSKVQQGWNSHRNSITSNQTISQQPCQKVKREAIWHWGFVTRQFIQSLRLPPYWRV